MKLTLTAPREEKRGSGMAVDEHTSGKLTVRQAAFIGRWK
jgi:hypothetical protein